MKRTIFFVLLLAFNSFIFASNVYFSPPIDGKSYPLDGNGNAGVSYHILTASLFFTTDWYGARVQFPDGHYSSWQTGQSGGWVFHEAGTYKIQGAIHVLADGDGNTDYHMYSEIQTITVLPAPVLTASMSGPFELDYMENGTWTISASGGSTPYSYSWSYYKPCGSASSILSKDKDKGGDIIITPDGAPCGSWISLASTSSSVTRYDYSSFTIKCVITDAQNSTITCSRTVLIGGALAKENSPENDKNDDIVVERLENFPNPFNPNTKVSFAIPETGHVSLKVYNSLGKQVAELVNSVLLQGQYEYEFDGSRLASGIYFANLQTKDKTLMRKLLLVK